MSAAKRSRQRQADAGAATSLPPAKRSKTTKNHEEQPDSLSFLTDERKRSQKSLKADLTNGTNKSRINNVRDVNGKAGRKPAVVDKGDEDDKEGSGSELSASSEEPSSESSDEEEQDTEQRALNGAVDHGSVKDVEDRDAETGDVKHANQEQSTVLASRPAQEDIDMDEAEDETTAPTFGDLMQQSQTDFIDVASKFTDFETSKALTTASGSRALQAPSANSLGTVLSQALRTNDRELLESCLQTSDTDSIRATMQRLQSSLVVELMHKLAERLHKRPGRAGSMMHWIQWALITHGNYMSSQPQLVKQLRSLRQVVHDRAASLPHLVTLKGKLDMLGAQVELRRAQRLQRARDSDSDDDDVDVVYVDGQNDDFSSSEDEDTGPTRKSKLGQKPARALAIASLGANEDLNGDDDIPLINGVDDDAEAASLNDSDSEAEVNGGFIDDEAEESEDGESISSEDDDQSEDEESDDDQHDLSAGSSEDEATQKRSRPAKRNALIRKR